MSAVLKKCSCCGGENLVVANTAANGGEGPRLLPKLGSLLFSPRFNVVLCLNCGLTQFFAEPEAWRKAAERRDVWKPLD